MLLTLEKYVAIAYSAPMRTIRGWSDVAGITLLSAWLAGSSAAQQEPLIVDLATGFSPAHVVEEHFFHWRGLDFFIVRDEEHGAELWVSGPSTDGPRLLRDLNPGPRFSLPRFPGVASDRLLFVANVGLNVVLWSTDGTTSGTRQVATVGELPNDGVTKAELGQDAYYFSRRFLTGYQVWRSDGTPEGTQPALDICAHPLCSSVRSGRRLNDKAVFVEGADLIAVELGQTRRTVLDPDCRACRFTVEVDGSWFLTDGFVDLLVTNGTPEGTERLDLELLRSYKWAASPTALFALVQGSSQPELVRVDARTRRVTTLHRFDDQFPLALGVVGSSVLVLAYDSSVLGTVLVSISTASGQAVNLATLTEESASFQGALTVPALQRWFFLLRVGSSPASTRRYVLFASNGTTSGTRELAEFPFATSLVEGGPEVRFLASDSGHGLQLYASDGSASGPVLVSDFDLLPDSSQPRAFVERDGNSVFFNYVQTNRSGAIGRYRHDVVGRFQEPVALDSVPALLGNQLFYLSDDGRLLNGAAEITSGFTELGIARQSEDRLYLGVSNNFEAAVVSTDGTASGTHTTTFDICGLPIPLPLPCPGYLGPSHLEPLAGGVVFDLEGSLFYTDELLTDRVTLANGLFGDVLVHDNLAYFTVGRSGTWLVMASNGVSGESHLPGLENSENFAAADEPTLVLHNDSVHFFQPTEPDSRSPSLWRASGLDASVVLAEPLPGGGEFIVLGAVSTPSGLIFRVQDLSGLQRSGLWWTDGSTSRFLADVGDGPFSTRPEATLESRTAATYGDRVVFSGFDAESGYEPWVTDGTERGTFRFADINPGTGSSSPENFSIVDDRIFFSAIDPEVGRELVILSTDALFAAPELTINGESLVLEGEPLMLSATSSEPLDNLCWRFGDELTTDLSCTATGADVTHVYELPGNYEVTLRGERTLPSGTIQSVTAKLEVVVGDDCFGCLGEGRFVVSVDWALRDGTRGSGTPLAFSDDTVLFWFFDEGNVELAVKVLDGTVINAHHWVIYGALSDVEYTVTVEDTRSGETKTYDNEAGDFCGAIDIEALPATILPVSTTAATGQLVDVTAPLVEVSQEGGSCGSATSLCLQDGRFQVNVSFFDPGSETMRAGRPIPTSDESGMFWFFDEGNVELLVKILDGRPVNGHHWLYYGGLSDVAYRLEITNTATGEITIRENAAGEICGGAFVDLLD